MCSTMDQQVNNYWFPTSGVPRVKFDTGTCTQGEGETRERGRPRQTGRGQV